MAKYAEKIAISKDAKEKKGLEMEAKNADLRLQKALLDAEATVELRKNEAEAAESAVPFDIDEVVEARRSVEDAEQDLADLQKIKADLF